MERLVETSDQLSPNTDVGTSVSPSSTVTSVHHVETDNTAVHPEQEQSSRSSSSSESRPQPRWELRYMLQRFQIPVPSFGYNDNTSDTWSCTIVILTFWFFASMIMILGFYGSYTLELWPNCSYEIEANPLFARSIQAQNADDDDAAGTILYGFHKSPSLDVPTTWSKSHTVFVEPNLHREWKYHLNAGSRVAINYDVKHPNLEPLSLVIAKGRAALLHWMDYPSYPNTTLSWNTIHGTGNITQDITHSDTYYVAVGNLNLVPVEVFLNITVQSVLYNTSNAVFKCVLSNRACSFKLALFKPNVAVLATPGARQVSADDDLYIQVSFGPQWLFYCSGSCIVTTLILVLFRCCDQSQDSQPNITYVTGDQGSENVAQREPLLPSKSDDSSSMGSSYESATNEEDDAEENIVEGSIVTKDGGSNSNNYNARLCAICFDAPKDCFFVPCGHSATCFSCGSRIADEAGICPICRRKMKKVRKIFLV